MIPGDAKKNDGLSDELAERLSLGIPEARHLVCAFSRGMAGELLASGNIYLGGVGLFSVAYVPSEKKTGVTGIVYTSPRNRLVFDPKISGRDDSRRIALTGVSVADVDAERFRRTLLSVLSSAVKQKREIRLKGFGMFAHDDGTYTFFPERSFDELLNREYLNLDEVVLPLRDPAGNVTRAMNGRKNRRSLLMAAIFLFAGLLLGVLYVTGLPGSFQTGLFQDRTAQLPPARTWASNQPAETEETPGGVQKEPAALDSLILAEGDFTIVLATFRRAETANREARRLRSEGFPAFVWSVSDGGRNYFSVATGRFSDIGTAKLAIGKLPESVIGDACVQKVIKEVVLHGKKEL